MLEPDYWNVVFHPSESRLARLTLGRFQHVSAFAYVPGYHAWIMFDCQWGGMRIGLMSHPAMMMNVHYSDWTLVKFNRQYHRLALLSRFGFYCVPAIKQLLGLSCVAVTPDGLYRHLIANGGEIIGQRIEPSPAAAGSDAAAGTAAGPG